MKAEPYSAPKRPHQPTQPTAQPPTQATPATLKNSNTAAMSRRTEIDLRTLMQGLETSSSSMITDGLVFAQLIQPVKQTSDDSSGLGAGTCALSGKPDAMGAQLVDELAQRLPIAPPGTFTATLLMPNLGKVQVRAGKREGHWEVELGFARRSTFERLHPQQSTCEATLAAAIGSSIRLSMVDEANA